MSRDRSTAASRPLPLFGFLCLIAGGGVLYTAQELAGLLEQWEPWPRAIGSLAGVILLLWGVWLIVTGLAPRSSAKVSRLNRNRVMLPREGMMYLLIMIVCFVASLIGRSNMLMLVFSIMAGPFIINGWITYTMLRRLRIQRDCPPRTTAGEITSVEVSLANRRFWFSSWLMTVRDHVHPLADDSGSSMHTDQIEPAVLFASVRPRSTRSASYQMRLNRRGRYELGPLEVSTRFPLGLVERGFIVEDRCELLVHPTVGQLTRNWFDAALTAPEPVQQPQSRRGIFDDDMRHLREYRPGDNPRDIHWRTSARQNQLIVREYQQTRERSQVLLLDLWQSSAPTPEELDHVELAISFAATICREHARQTRGSNQTVFATGDRAVRIEPQSGLDAMTPILDELAIINGGAAASLDSLAAELAPHITTATRCLLITTRPEPDRTESASRVRDILSTVEVFPATLEEVSRWFLPARIQPAISAPGQPNESDDSAAD